MLLFCYGIDPHLVRLSNQLEGITLYSLPVLPGENPLVPLTEKYKVIGYCDDCKPAITNMSEFSLVERETRLFEAASGTMLHRDPSSGKVKFLRLGRWRGTLQKEDLPSACQYIALSDFLDMLGLKLFASFKKTRQICGNELQDKFQRTVGVWRLRFMELTQRPFSCNTYLLPKAWYRCHVMPLRVGDENNLKKQVSYFFNIERGAKFEQCFGIYLDG